MENEFKRKAATLTSTGEKIRKLDNGDDEYNYKIPQRLFKAVFKNFDANCSVLLLLLMNTQEDTFILRNKWIENMTGMSQPASYRARKDLINAKVLEYDQNSSILTIHYDALWELVDQKGKYKRKRNK